VHLLWVYLLVIGIALIALGKWVGRSNQHERSEPPP
jgi:hypothetical protein